MRSLTHSGYDALIDILAMNEAEIDGIRYTDTNGTNPVDRAPMMGYLTKLRTLIAFARFRADEGSPIKDWKGITFDD